MKYAIESIDGDRYFSTELNELFFISPDDGEINLRINIAYLQDKDLLFNIFTIDGKKNAEIHLSGLGDALRDFIMEYAPEDKIPNALIYLRLIQGGKEFIFKSFFVIPHFGNPHLVAMDYIHNHFLNDCPIKALPYGQYSTNFYNLYFGIDTAGFKATTKANYTRSSTATSQFPNIESRILPVPFFPVTDSIKYCMTTVEKNSEAIDGFMSQIWMVPPDEGCYFWFRNSFGLAEIVFIPGTVSTNTKKDSSEVVASGKIEEADISITETFSIKVDSAPWWLVDCAKALLNSGFVYLIEDFGEYDSKQIILKKSNIIVSDLAGDISRSADKLSEFMLTFKRSDQ